MARVTVGLVGMTPDLAALLADALADARADDAGADTRLFPLHADTVSVLAKVRLSVLLVDGHPFTDMGAFVRALRASPATERLPVLVLTARLRDDLTGDLGPVEQIEMPFDVGELLAKVSRAAQSDVAEGADDGKDGGRVARKARRAPNPATTKVEATPLKPEPRGSRGRKMTGYERSREG